ncbi:MAG: type VI secretion system protein TssA [Piscinibacter sp.]|nr:type VI secretion system protein TssA [Piscinibacter sp.]
MDAWLEPLGDPPCGEDLEWDNEFLEMSQAAVAKPGSQFSNDTDAKPADWRAVKRLAESLFERTRDVRVAIYWARAQVNLDGATTLPASLRLVHGLLERYWDDVHPKPDDGDAYARVNALNDMAGVAGLVGDMRQSSVVPARGFGDLRGREIEVALGLLEPREGESAMQPAQLQQMFAEVAAEDPVLRGFAGAAVGHLEKIDALMRERVGYGSAPDLNVLKTLLSGIQGLMPGSGGAGGAEDSAGDGADAGEGSFGDAAPVARRSAARGGGLPGSIESRDEALRAIDLVCAYLERTEPTNPAQFFLRRARKLVDKNFLELVRELAPDSLDQVARIMGVPSDEYSSGSSY